MTYALQESAWKWARSSGPFDLLVGIPTFNNERSIGRVVELIGKGLSMYFPRKRSAILVSDGGSLDDSREQAAEASLPRDIHRHVAIYRGIPGKGTAVRAILEMAKESHASAAAIIDGDVRSLGLEWTRNLLEPILEETAHFVAPYYRRHKFDSTITNHIVYPLTRALYSVQVRQPIGGDFGFSPDLARFYLRQDVWGTDVARFGIDIWMTTCAINEGFPIAQAYLGTKAHDVKDPAADLPAMFQQVVSTLFYLSRSYKRRWNRHDPIDVIPVNRTREEEPEIPPVEVDIQRLREEFLEGFEHFRSVYRQHLASETMAELLRIHRTWKSSTRPDQPLDADLWSRILYDFIVVYQGWRRNRRRLVDLLTPLYFGRTKSHCEQVLTVGEDGAESLVQEQAETFTRNKSYLLAHIKDGEGTSVSS